MSTVIWGEGREILYEESCHPGVFNIDRTGKTEPTLKNRKSELQRRQGWGKGCLQNHYPRSRQGRAENGSIRPPEQPDSGTAPNQTVSALGGTNYKGGRKKGLSIFAFLEV